MKEVGTGEEVLQRTVCSACLWGWKTAMVRGEMKWQEARKGRSQVGWSWIHSNHRGGYNVPVPWTTSKGGPGHKVGHKISGRYQNLIQDKKWGHKQCNFSRVKTPGWLINALVQEHALNSINHVWKASWGLVCKYRDHLLVCHIGVVSLYLSELQGQATLNKRLFS